MKNELAIELRKVTVRYNVPHERIPTLKEFTIRWLRGHVSWREFEALSCVDLCVRSGEALGIVGRNGAGKSTLLKVVAQVLRPIEGIVRTRGRVVPLLELGAGVDPELSGLENIFLNGAMLGHSRRYMAERVASIVDFAGLDQFIDAPVRTYSTGMVARLGFAIATDVEPDILLVDEVLSVGDVEFQRKCMERMNRFHEEGVTLVMASHSMEMIAAQCGRAVWLDNGHVRAVGEAAGVTAQFEGDLGDPARPETL